MCSEQVKLEQSQLAMVHANLDALNEKHEGAAQKIVDLKEAFCVVHEEEHQVKVDVLVKSTLLAVANKQVDETSKVLSDIEIVPILSPNDMKKLGKHEQSCYRCNLHSTVMLGWTITDFTTQYILFLLFFDV